MKTTTHGTMLAALLLAGCTGIELTDELDPSQPEVEGDFAPEDLEFELEGLGPANVPVTGRPVNEPTVTCIGAPIIGLLDNPLSDCELGGLPVGWQAKRMFATGTPDLLALTTPLPDELERYCVYTRSSPPTVEPEYYSLFDTIDASGLMDLSTTAADCMGEMPQSTLYDPSVGQGIYDAFAANTDLVTGLELGPTAVHRRPIELMIIDTASHIVATTHWLEPKNFHGLQLGSMMREVLCPSASPSCLPNIQHAVGLARVDWNTPPDFFIGGLHGTQGDIARSIYARVTNWRERVDANPELAPERMVLNLSLGWDRDVGHSLDPNRGPTASLELALEYASCMGVITIAAAGNNADPDCPDDRTGPTNPGGYETMPAPDAVKCAALGFGGAETFPRPIFGGPVGYRPLVYAVGGVDGHDQDLINTRELGQPRMVSYATYGTSGSGPSGEALTGTSVSAGLTSAAAALLWSYRPELRPSEIMDLLYQSGYDTGVAADFVGIGASSNTMRRLSVCAALDLACASEPASTCPHLSCVAMPPGPHGYQDDFFSATTAVLVDPGTTIEAWTSGLSGTSPTCTTPPDYSILAEPQPEIPVCSHCSIDIPPEFAASPPGDDTLIIGIDSNYSGLVQGVKLTVYDATRTILTYDLDTYAASLDATIVTTIGLHAPDTVRAYLEFTVPDPADPTKTVTQSNAVTVNFTGTTLIP